MEQEKEISGKQYAFLIFIVGMSMKLLMLPVLILKSAGRDGWLIYGIYFALEFACLAALLCVAKAEKDKTFFEILSAGFGKVAAKIIAVVFTVFLFAKMCLMITEMRLFFKVTVFENMAWQAYVIPVLALMLCFGVRSLRGIGRTAEIFVPYIGAVVVGMAILAGANLLPKNFLPVLADGGGKIFGGVGKYPLWFGDFTLMLVFQGKIKSGKKLVPLTITAAVAAFVAVMYFGLTVFTSFANLPDVMSYGHSIASVTQNNALQSFGRFDLLFLSVWTITIILTMGSCFHFIIDSAVFVAGKKWRMWFSLGLCVLLYAAVVLLFPNETGFFVFATGWFRIFAFIVQLALPLLLIAAAVISRMREKRKGAKEPRVKDKEENAV